MLNLYEKCMKKRCFFGPSIWRAFWEGLGRVLGGPNPRFSQFFRCFFDIFSKQFLKELILHFYMQLRQTFPLFGGGFAVYGTCLGRDYREGKHENLMRHLQQGHSMLVSGVWCWSWWYWSSTPCTTFGGRRIETPRGGPPPPAHLCPGHCDRIGLRDWTPGFAFRKWLAFLAFLAFLVRRKSLMCCVSWCILSSSSLFLRICAPAIVIE